MPDIPKCSHTKLEYFAGRHRFEHWYRDNSVYFITSKARDGRPVFLTPDVQAVFWDRFAHYAREFGFVPWVTTLMSNHYHTLGYLKVGRNLGPMMQRFHGSVAKLTNDLLLERHVPFWRTATGKDYFDGCIRDAVQCHRAYRYTLRQSERHGICQRWNDYKNTRVEIDLDVGVKRAIELKAFVEEVPYARYVRKRSGR